MKGNRMKLQRLMGITVIFFLITTLSLEPPATASTNIKDKATKAHQFVEEGFYIDALPLLEECLSMREKSIDSSDFELVDILSDLAVVYSALAEYDKAVGVQERALEISKEHYGPDHENVDRMRERLMRFYQGKMAYDRIEQMYQIALAEKERKYGLKSIELVDDMIQLAQNYRMMGKDGEAETLLQEAVAIRKDILGSDHPKVADVMNKMALFYMSSRAFYDLVKAEHLARKAIAIKENALGQNHQDVAEMIDTLAIIMLSQRKSPNELEGLRKRSLAIKENVYGSESQKLYLPLLNLAQFYHFAANFDQAEAIYKRILSLKGLKATDRASSLQILAGFYRQQGRIEDAIPLYINSIENIEHAYGSTSMILIGPLSVLSSLYQTLSMKEDADKIQSRIDFLTAESKKQSDMYEKAGEKRLSESELEQKKQLEEKYSNIKDLCSKKEYDAAMKATVEYLDFKEKIEFYGPGDSHLKKPLTALHLTTVAGIFHQHGGIAQAEILYRQAIEYFDEGPPEIVPFVSFPLDGLAGLLYSSGNFKGAKEPCERLVDFYQKGSDPGAFKLSYYLNTLGFIDCILGNYNNAQLYFKNASDLENKVVLKVMGFAPQRQKLSYMSGLKNQTDAILSLTSLKFSDNQIAVQDAVNLQLFRKGIILEIAKNSQEALIYSDNAEAAGLFKALSDTRRQLSDHFFSTKKMSNQKLSEIDARIEDLESKLSQVSRTVALRQKILNPDYESVIKALPANSVMLEFAKTKMLNLKAQNPGEFWRPPHYIVFILRSNDQNNISIVDLGKAEEIETAISRFKHKILNLEEMKGKDEIPEAIDLYKMAFQPLEQKLAGVTNIFISPDGELNLIPFEVFQKPNGRFLIEDYIFNYVSAGRDILSFGIAEAKGMGTLLIGDPDFNMDEMDDTAKESHLKDLRIAVQENLVLSGYNFERLPGTKAEIEEIQDLIGKENTISYSGRDARKEVLEQMTSPRILHLATHAFFLNDIDYNQYSGLFPAMRGVGGITSLEMELGQKTPEIKIPNPLLRSGIVLAGANSSVYNGILTSEEILNLKLHDTEMVVLSACDTGVGTVEKGEGVFGLRRAFTQAGARGIVMSMWSIPDQETMELMTEFYKNITFKKMKKNEALRQAALHEMNIVKDRYGNRNPLFWGGFVYVGEQ
jgi:CHAT domain-containing protein